MRLFKFMELFLLVTKVGRLGSYWLLSFIYFLFDFFFFAQGLFAGRCLEVRGEVR